VPYLKGVLATYSEERGIGFDLFGILCGFSVIFYAFLRSFPFLHCGIRYMYWLYLELALFVICGDSSSQVMSHALTARRPLKMLLLLRQATSSPAVQSMITDSVKRSNSSSSVFLSLPLYMGALGFDI
jgi:hypothetical protein